MDFLPIFMDVRGRTCLIVGGGEVAARKVQMLLRAGAKVEVVAPELGNTMQTFNQEGKIQWIEAGFDPAHLQNPALVYAATDRQSINQQVSELAKEKNIPVNVVDTPSLCNFITPSIIDRSPVVAAISTGGASPVLAR
ncbi:MAG TPA: bifunctional precorrin-2 dehydrogenase/sirohydrochlorin ferrochelatase, partial [Gammaproteobacteria bacterium]|nr:bifunctional precorrin-2 dehydrogenase/sirohydrochlorin ferrochelatase [Gammaproteobacteria bacterium]